jgi:hypothetical protein
MDNDIMSLMGFEKKIEQIEQANKGMLDALCKPSN